MEDRVRSRYTEVTRGIRIVVSPEPIEDQSDPVGGIYTFAYTIQIHNDGEVPAQLLERHWLIFSGEEQIAEVVGPGVVGVQPRIVPGESFEYQSSAVIHDPVGAMEGSYTFKTDAGSFFEVKIPRFDLLYKLMLH